MDLSKLLELRESIRTSVRQLEDIKSERALSTNQARALTKYQEQLGDLDGQIEEARALESRAVEERQRTIAALGATDFSAALRSGPAVGSERFAGADASRPAASTDTMELRSYGLGDKDLRSAFDVRDNAPTLGQHLRAMVTGRTDGLTAEQRTLISSGGAAAINGASMLNLVDMAMQESNIFAAGARIVPLKDGPSAKIARITAQPAVQWAPDTAERDLEDGAFVIEPQNLASRSVWVYATISRESWDDCVGLEGAVVTAFSRQLALAFDHGALIGAGSTAEPLGICNMTNATDGIAELADVGVLADYKPFVRAAGKVLANHHTPTSVMFSSGTYTDLACLQATDDQPLMPPAAYSKLAETVNDLIGDEYAVVGDLSKLVVGVRTDAQIEVVSTGVGFKKGQIEVRGLIRYDVALEDPGAVCLMSGIGDEEASV